MMGMISKFSSAEVKGGLSNLLLLKRILLYAIIFLFIVGVIAALVINLDPAFGGNLTEEQKKDYRKYPNFINGKFVNLSPTSLNLSLQDNLSMMKESFSSGQNREPVGQIPVVAIDWNQMKSEQDSLTWFGHSAFLVSLDNKKILVDPMLGARASPFSFGGSKRYTGSMLNLIDEMPAIDAVLITHDHYDHLDESSIRKLSSKTANFFVPLGVGNHLLRWGIPKEKITELYWWDEIELGGLKVAFTPSRHFSGRGPFNQNTTLWGGWVIIGQKTRFYTSGDGGYGEHFKEIGEKYGPFDIALIEGAQYNRRWPEIHMTPEEAIQAHKDVQGKDMMLIHWGAFTLAFHGWTEPIERAIQAAKQEGIHLIAPQIGETLILNREDSTSSITPWWIM